ASFPSWHGVAMSAHQPLLTAVLKGRMGFDGFVVGDWNSHALVAGCTKFNCPAAVDAGLDMYMAPESWKELYTNTLQQVRAGQIPAGRLDDAVRRVLRVKLRAHLLDEGRPSSRPLAGHYELLGAPEHRAVARQAVRESLVLLKNSRHLLRTSWWRAMVPTTLASNVAAGRSPGREPGSPTRTSPMDSPFTPESSRPSGPPGARPTSASTAISKRGRTLPSSCLVRIL